MHLKNVCKMTFCFGLNILNPIYIFHGRCSMKTSQIYPCSHWGHWWRRLQPMSSIITDAKPVDSNLYDFPMQWWCQLNRGADVITGLSRCHPYQFSKDYIWLSTRHQHLSFLYSSKSFKNYMYAKNPSRNMHVYPAKSSRFGSTDFASVMIDDVGCSRRHQCPQCACFCILPLEFGVNITYIHIKTVRFYVQIAINLQRKWLSSLVQNQIW